MTNHSPAVEETANRLCGEIETLMALPSGSVTLQTSLPTLGIDSLKFVSLLLAIEQRFGVNLMKGGLKPADLETAVTMATAIEAGRNA
jgi:acyl carrier protein